MNTFKLMKEGPLFKIEGEHWVVRAVKLYAFTDSNDTLCAENEMHLFKRELFKPLTGDIFFLEDSQSGNAAVIISDNADYNVATLSIADGVVTVDSQGCDINVGFCKVGECEEKCRRFLQSRQGCHGLVSMSNTWGDKNGSTRVCREFVLKEIDAASELGIDIVQIDDGWQVGDTAWRSERDELGRIFRDGYWECNRERFPDELAPIVEYAGSKGIKTGMWFAPDTHDCYAHLERDCKVLKKAYDEWGIRFFKLDMYSVRNDEEKQKMLSLLEYLHAFGNDVTVQMDITRHSRLNYLAAKQYGTVFVENRYTGSGNSFPHRILRNLWMICRYVPASRFQFEIVNPDLNTELYSEDDPFAPSRYDIDYLFASVMLCNPLFWMELQFLSEERKLQLQNIMKVWKEHRDALAECDISPIGQKPCGRSFTGFAAAVDGKVKYLLLFREVTKNESAVIPLEIDAADIEIIATNAECNIKVRDGSVEVNMSKPRSYAFIKIK